MLFSGWVLFVFCGFGIIWLLGDFPCVVFVLICVNCAFLFVF